ncbi:hypothetical protein [Nostoc sp.]
MAKRPATANSINYVRLGNEYWFKTVFLYEMLPPLVGETSIEF